VTAAATSSPRKQPTLFRLVKETRAENVKKSTLAVFLQIMIG